MHHDFSINPWNDYFEGYKPDKLIGKNPTIDFTFSNKFFLYAVNFVKLQSRCIYVNKDDV